MNEETNYERTSRNDEMTKWTINCPRLLNLRLGLIVAQIVEINSSVKRFVGFPFYKRN